jgi:hypothetical protein
VEDEKLQEEIELLRQQTQSLQSYITELEEKHRQEFDQLESLYRVDRIAAFLIFSRCNFKSKSW